MDRTASRLLAQWIITWLADHAGAEQAHSGKPVELGDDFGAWIGDRRLRLRIVSAASGEPPPLWDTRLTAFAERLCVPESANSGGLLLWLPAGASLPNDEPAASSAIDAIERAIARVPPGSAAEAALPITIAIRKRDEASAYISASGGLAPLWARFTDRVQGHFQVDASSLHRLPPGDGYTDSLIDRIVEASKGLSVGEIRSVSAEDHWHVQRVQSRGCAVVGIHPQDESEAGAPLRKRLRTIVRAASEQLAASSETNELRILAVVGHYASLDNEPVGTALRGLDPGLFGGLDLILLAAEGRAKPLIDITRRTFA